MVNRKLNLRSHDPHPGSLVRADRAYWIDECSARNEDRLRHKIGIVLGVIDIECEALCQYVVLWTGPYAHELVTLEVAHRLRGLASPGDEL